MGCVGICGGLMRCRLCREDNEMEAVRGYWGDVLGDGRGILAYYICKEIKRDVYTAVELISRPTIRAVSHL